MKYKMILCEEVPGRGPDWWIIYPTGGSYIKDEVDRMPAGSKLKDGEAARLLNWMNDVASGNRRSAIMSREDLVQHYKDKIANHREIGIPCFEQLG